MAVESTEPKLFGIAPYVDQAVARVRRAFDENQADALVIGVFGEWGSGKSTVLGAISSAFPKTPNHLVALADLRAGYEPQVLTVEFNSWRFEREEHLLIPLLKTVQHTLLAFAEACEGQSRAVDLDQIKRASRWLVDRATLAGSCAIALTKMFKLKADIPLLGSVELAPYDALKAAQDQVDRAKGDGARAEAATAADLSALPSLYYDLHNQLRQIAVGNQSDARKLHFLFLIDDLDRCLPDKAVEMLEAIKLFLDIPECVFILALDDEVVERGIAHRYRDYLQLTDRSADSIAYSLKPERYEEYLGRHANQRQPPITGSEYLEKIVQLPFRLPRWSSQEARAFLLQRFPALFAVMQSAGRGDPEGPAQLGMKSRDQGVVRRTKDSSDPGDWLLDLFVQAIPPVPRKLVRAAELFEFVQGVAKARKLNLQTYTLAQLVLLQLFSPQCFRFLRRERREAWKSLEQRMLESRGTAGASAVSGNPGGFSGPSFFNWWEQGCARRLAGSEPDPYIKRVEKPFIAELRQACQNRDGFDPRRLFLLGTSWRVDDNLEPYFSLFAAPLPVRATMREESVQASPVEPVRFVQQMLAPNRESWLNAINNETALRGKVLDDATFNLLMDGFLALESTRKGELAGSDWLALVLGILSTGQILAMYERAKILDAMTDLPRLT